MGKIFQLKKNEIKKKLQKIKKKENISIKKNN